MIRPADRTPLHRCRTLSDEGRRPRRIPIAPGWQERLRRRGAGAGTRVVGERMPPLALDSVATLTPLARWMSDPARVPRVSLTTLPTPVAPLERLAQASGLPPLRGKRDGASG